MIQSVSFVKEAFISQGSGMLDFEQSCANSNLTFFIVNEDGNIPEKRELARNWASSTLSCIVSPIRA